MLAASCGGPQRIVGRRIKERQSGDQAKDERYGQQGASGSPSNPYASNSAADFDSVAVASGTNVE